MGKSVLEWLEEGRQLMAQEEADRRAWLESQAEAALENWRKLVAFVGEDMGPEFASNLQCPCGWTVSSDSYSHGFRPFGAGELRCIFGRAGDGSWHCRDQARSSGDPKPYQVAGDYRAKQVSHGRWEPRSFSSSAVSNLAKAVALCAMQTDGYKRAQAECDRFQNLPIVTATNAELAA